MPGALDRYALVAFVAEARRQAAYVELAASNLEDAVQRQDPDRLWSSIHSLLVAIRNVSKLLWPYEASPGQNPRGLIMRAVLKRARSSEKCRVRSSAVSAGSLYCWL